MEEEKISIEKPKKQKQPISEKQKEQLRMMREKKKAYKIAGVKPNQLKQNQPTQPTQPETRREYQPVSELVKLSDDIAFIKNHILEKRN